MEPNEGQRAEAERICKRLRLSWVHNGEPLARLLAEFEREVLMLSAERIREHCGPCDGRGYNVESHVEARPDPDGNPVPVEVVESSECEYCGRPIAALRGASPQGPGK